MSLMVSLSLSLLLLSVSAVVAFPLDGVYALVSCQGSVSCASIWPEEANVVFTVVSNEDKIINFTAVDVNHQLPTGQGTVNGTSGIIVLESPYVSCNGIAQSFGASRGVFFCQFEEYQFDLTYQCVSGNCATNRPAEDDSANVVPSKLLHRPAALFKRKVGQSRLRK